MSYCAAAFLFAIAPLPIIGLCADSIIVCTLAHISLIVRRIFTNRYAKVPKKNPNVRCLQMTRKLDMEKKLCRHNVMHFLAAQVNAFLPKIFMANARNAK